MLLFNDILTCHYFYQILAVYCFDFLKETLLTLQKLLPNIQYIREMLEREYIKIEEQFRILLIKIYGKRALTNMLRDMYN